MVNLEHDSDGSDDENEEKTDEEVENCNVSCNSNITTNESEEEMIENGDDKMITHGKTNREDLLQPGSIPITAATYAALFTATSKDHMESARNIIRVPAHRPHVAQLSQMSFAPHSLPNGATSSSSPGSLINSSTSSELASSPSSLFSTSGSTTHLGNVPTDFLPWSPYRPFSSALPGYLPIQAGFLGPKFGGK